MTARKRWRSRSGVGSSSYSPVALPAAYLDSGTQGFQALGILLAIAAVTLTIDVPGSLGASGDTAAKAIFYVPRRKTRPGPAIAAGGRRGNDAGPGGCVPDGSRPRRNLGVGARPVGDVDRSCACRRIPDAIGRKLGRSCHLELRILVAAAAGSESIGCATAGHIRCHHGRGGRLPRPRRFLSRCPFVWTPQDSDSQRAPTAETVDIRPAVSPRYYPGNTIEVLPPLAHSGMRKAFNLGMWRLPSAPHS